LSSSDPRRSFFFLQEPEIQRLVILQEDPNQHQITQQRQKHGKGHAVLHPAEEVDLQARILQGSGGDLPIIVPIPPVDAASGIPTSNALEKDDSLPRLAIIGITAAITIAVVAVFDIRFEAIIVVSISPSRSLRGVVPDRRRVS
jgi:hypothetical protein